MEVVELRWLLVLAELEHVTRAAEAVHLSQPALSKAIARLEREVGLPLFDRRGRTLRLNRHGRLFRDGVERALSELDTTRRHLAELIGPESGTVPLGFLPTLGTWLVPELVRSFRADHPGVRLQLHQSSADGLVQALRAGLVDLILSSQHPQDRGVGWRRLHLEALRLVTPVGHPLARQRGGRGVPLVAAASEPFVMLRSGLGLRELTEELCTKAGFVPTVAFEGEEVETVRGLVSAGLGVALLPEAHPPPEDADSRRARGSAAAADMADRHPGTVDLPVSVPRCHREIGLAWNLDRYRSPAVEAFRGHVLLARRGN